MKHLYPTLPIVGLILICISCNEDPATIQKKVSVDFTVSSDNGTVSDLPPGSHLLLNIQTQNGEPVMEYQEVGFTQYLDHFSTKPLDLPYGNYVLTDLIIVDDNDDIVYAAPKSTGTLASSVEHPLGFDFVSSPDAGTAAGMHLRLMDVRKFRPGDFGYASFKKPGRRINIMIRDEDDGKPVAARALFSSD